jgi:hypothetical protein
MVAAIHQGYVYLRMLLDGDADGGGVAGGGQAEQIGGYAGQRAGEKATEPSIGGGGGGGLGGEQRALGQTVCGAQGGDQA